MACLFFFSYMLFFLQRIGYLAASQCFHESTDVIMLTTNQIRKVGDALVFMYLVRISRLLPLSNLFCLIDIFHFLFLSFFQDLSSPNQYDTGVALTGLSCFVTPDLARDLANDIMTLVSRAENAKFTHMASPLELYFLSGYQFFPSRSYLFIFLEHCR